LRTGGDRDITSPMGRDYFGAILGREETDEILRGRVACHLQEKKKEDEIVIKQKSERGGHQT